jgi:hypothetical protein
MMMVVVVVVVIMMGLVVRMEQWKQQFWSLEKFS